MDEKTKKIVFAAIILFAIIIGIVGILFVLKLVELFSLLTPAPAQNTLVIKVSSDGIPEWQTMFQGSVGLLRMHPAPDNGYLVFGGINTAGFIVESMVVMKINPDGKIAWQFVRPSNAYYPQIVFLNPAAYLLSDNGGFTVIDGSGTIIHLDDRGNELWHRNYYSNVMDARATSDGGYALSGTYYYRVPALQQV
jgi:hypothetical protein